MYVSFALKETFGNEVHVLFLFAFKMVTQIVPFLGLKREGKFYECVNKVKSESE